MKFSIPTVYELQESAKSNREADIAKAQAQASAQGVVVNTGKWFKEVV